MFQGLGAQLQKKLLGLPHWVETMQFFQNVVKNPSSNKNNQIDQM